MKYSWFLLACFLLFLACSDKKGREREKEAEQQRIEARFNEFRADSLQNYLVSLYRDPQIRARMNANENLLPNWRLLKEPGHKQSKINSSRAKIRADKLQDHISMLYADPVVQRKNWAAGNISSWTGRAFYSRLKAHWIHPTLIRKTSHYYLFRNHGWMEKQIFLPLIKQQPLVLSWTLKASYFGRLLKTVSELSAN